MRFYFSGFRVSVFNSFEEVTVVSDGFELVGFIIEVLLLVGLRTFRAVGFEE